MEILCLCLDSALDLWPLEFLGWDFFVSRGDCPEASVCPCHSLKKAEKGRHKIETTTQTVSKTL